MSGLLIDVDVTAGRIGLAGELDRSTCGDLPPACQMLAAAGPPIWVVDLVSLDFCDASGLRALAAVRRAESDAGAALVVVGARPLLRRLLTLVGLGDVLAPIARTTQGLGVDRAARAFGVAPTAASGPPVRTAVPHSGAAAAVGAAT